MTRMDDDDAQLVLGAIEGPVRLRPQFESELLSALATQLGTETSPPSPSSDGLIHPTESRPSER
jgi:hypothetical protein